MYRFTNFKISVSPSYANISQPLKEIIHNPTDLKYSMRYDQSSLTNHHGYSKFTETVSLGGKRKQKTKK